MTGAFSVGIAPAQDFDPDYMSTFSIIAVDPATDELGECVTSKAFAGGNGGFTGKGAMSRRTASNSSSTVRF